MGKCTGIRLLLAGLLFCGAAATGYATERAPVAGEVVQLDGSMSSDPDGDRLSYMWRQVGGAKVELQNAHTATPSFLPQQAGRYLFELVVSDGAASSAPARIEINVQRVNNAPIAMLPPKISVKVGQKVMLDATASKDPDGDALHYTWKQISGPEFMFREKLTRGPYVSFYPKKAGKYIFALVATDGEKESQPVQCVLEVIRPNSIPVARIRTSNTNVTIHQSPLGVADAAQDAPGDLTIDQLRDPDAAALVTQAINTNPVNTPRVSVEYTGKQTGSVAVGKIERANSAPMASTSPNMMAEPGEKVVLRGGGVDPDSDRLSYVWKQTAGPMIPGGPIRSKNLAFIPNREGVYIFELTVSDGELSSTPAACAVTVAKDINGLQAMRGGNQKEANLNDVDVPGIDPVAAPERGRGLFSRIFKGKK